MRASILLLLILWTIAGTRSNGFLRVSADDGVFQEESSEINVSNLDDKSWESENVDEEEGIDLKRVVNLQQNRKKGTSIHTSIKLYPSLFDHKEESAVIKRVTFTESVAFEIVTENGPPNIENVPIDCWVSRYPSAEESSANDEEIIYFLEDGCPAGPEVELLLTYSDKSINDFGPRVKFILGAFYTNIQQQDVLFIHCQYIKCVNGTSAEIKDYGRLPSCPNHACDLKEPNSYNDSQLWRAVSDVHLTLIRRPAQEIYIQPVPDSKNPCDISPICPAQPNVASTEPCISLHLAVISCVCAFFIGIFLMGTIFFFERRRLKKLLATKKSTHIEVGPTTNSVESSKLNYQPQPDVLDSTPALKRALNVRIGSSTRQVAGDMNRQRHRAGIDGYQPERPADSFHPMDLTVVGGSTIVRNDQEWIRRNTGDSTMHYGGDSGVQNV